MPFITIDLEDTNNTIYIDTDKIDAYVVRTINDEQLIEIYYAGTRLDNISFSQNIDDILNKFFSLRLKTGNSKVPNSYIAASKIAAIEISDDSTPIFTFMNGVQIRGLADNESISDIFSKLTLTANPIDTVKPGKKIRTAHSGISIKF